MVEPSEQGQQRREHRSPTLTEEHSFEFHRSGGSVEPARPGDLARQGEEAAEMTPVGGRADIRRGLLVGVACGLAFGVVLGAFGLLPWGVSTTWLRVGVMALIGFLAGLVYGWVWAQLVRLAERRRTAT